MKLEQFSERENELLAKSIETIKRNLNPNKIFLFGSRAKGNYQKNSDFDFAVDVKKPEKHLERIISKELNEFSGLYEIDIVYLNSIDDNFQDIILKTGIVLYERGN